jgi:hypothetical protein
MKNFKPWRMRPELIRLVFGRIAILFHLGIGEEAKGIKHLNYYHADCNFISEIPNSFILTVFV